MSLERKLKHRKLKRKYEKDWRVFVYPDKLSIKASSLDLNQLLLQYYTANWHIFLDKKSIVIHDGCYGVKYVLDWVGERLKKIVYISSCFLHLF